MENLKSTLGLKNGVDQFSSKELAYSFAERCIKQHIVILGDHDKFWVVCFSDAQKLVNLGYEIAE